MFNGFKLKKIYRTGYCLARGIFANRNLSWEKVRFYTRCFLLEHHKHGLILIDTGYGKDLIEATKSGIYSFYVNILPINYFNEDSIVYQLAQDGICLKDLSYLFLTHFHPDHIGSLPEFRTVPWIYRGDILHQLMNVSIWKGLKHGFIRSIIPSIPKGSISISEKCFVQRWRSFASIDLFEDDSFHIIDLPGHALGQMGVIIQDYFFIADAKWTIDAMPHPLGLFLQENYKTYQNTFKSLDDIPFQIYLTHTIESHV